MTDKHFLSAFPSDTLRLPGKLEDSKAAFEARSLPISPTPGLRPTQRADFWYQANTRSIGTRTDNAHAYGVAYCLSTIDRSPGRAYSGTVKREVFQKFLTVGLGSIRVSRQDSEVPSFQLKRWPECGPCRNPRSSRKAVVGRPIHTHIERRKRAPKQPRPGPWCSHAFLLATL